MPPSLLLTRPEGASQRFAARIAGLGVGVVISPIMRIVPVAHDGAALAAARGLVFTSTHAVAVVGPGRGRPAICVGPATAQAARDAGFVVTQGPGDAARLLPMLRDLGAGWLHPHGAHLAAMLPVPGMVVYAQQSQPLSPQGRAVLAGPGPVIVPVFSPRSARLVADAAHGARATLWVVAISVAAADNWHGPAARIGVAVTPDAAGMHAAIESLLAAEQSGDGTG